MTLDNLTKKGWLRGLATATPATPATHGTFIGPTVATVATVAVAKAPDNAANDPIPDADRWSWPHSAAMTGAEIHTFAVRLSRFTGTGLTLEDSEALADRLVNRDREVDGRGACLECKHLAGYASKGRCANWELAAIAFNAWDAGLPDEMVGMLQRCDGFSDAAYGQRTD